MVKRKTAIVTFMSCRLKMRFHIIFFLLNLNASFSFLNLQFGN